MAHYAIGDLQGCYASLCKLLERIHFDSSFDKIWFAGDIVNRGKKSLACLRFIKELAPQTDTVLGNHDLHLLALANGIKKPRSGDTLNEILAAPDLNELCDWLRHRPLMLSTQNNAFHLIHAGVPPQLDIQQASAYARELESNLRGAEYQTFLRHMYGDTPTKWFQNMTTTARWRYLLNAFTRLRYCHADGALDMSDSSPPGQQSTGLIPWYAHPERRSRQAHILFGHWSTVTLGETQDFAAHHVYPLDTGCLWGGALTALRLDDGQVFSVPCTRGDC